MKHITERIKNKIKIFATKINKKLRKFKKPISKEVLLDQLKTAGINPNDTLLLHSSLSPLGNISDGADTIIDAFLEQIGSSGTLAMPSYSYTKSMIETVKDKNFIFDLNTSPSVVGLITEKFRKRAGVKRSIHPTHSVCAFGKNAELIVNGHLEANTNFGEGTPFYHLLRLKGKMVGIGLSISVIPLYHTIEDLYPENNKGVYLADKFKLKVKVKDKIIDKEISIHNPEYHKIRIDKNTEILNWFTNYFTNNKLLHHAKFGNGKLWWIDMEELMKELSLLKKQGITIYNVPN